MTLTSYQIAPGPVKGSPPAVKTRHRTPNKLNADGPPRCSRRAVQNRNLQEVESRMETLRYKQNEHWRAVRLGTVTVPGTHHLIARINEIQHLGELDRFPGEHGYHIYEGWVGKGRLAVPMKAQIVQFGGDVVVTFWPLDGRARRLLVTARGQAYIEVWTKIGPKCIVHTGKFFRAWSQLLNVRPAHNEDGQEVVRG